MAKRNRSPVQSSNDWHNWLKQIQREIMLTRGENKSIPDIQDEILKDPNIKEIEKNLVKKQDLKMDIKIKLDRRLFG
jgi:hypothetical protein